VSDNERFTALVRDAHRIRHPEVEPGVLALPPSDRPFDGALLAFRLTDSWRLVTAGLARPDHVVPAMPEGASGFGIELSVRLPVGDSGRAGDRGRDDDHGGAGPDQPAPWASELLRVLADQVVASGEPFLPGHRLENRNPLDGDPTSTATCLLFTADRDLHRVDGPTGVFEFVQVVPVTRDELAEARDASTEAVIDRLLRDSPDLIARLCR
jgi:hypothetical protein